MKYQPRGLTVVFAIPVLLLVACATSDSIQQTDTMSCLTAEERQNAEAAMEDSEMVAVRVRVGRRGVFEWPLPDGSHTTLPLSRLIITEPGMYQGKIVRIFHSCPIEEKSLWFDFDEEALLHIDKATLDRYPVGVAGGTSNSAYMRLEVLQ